MSMIEVGDSAPLFSAPGSDGEEIRQFDLEQTLDTGPTILAFYPFDFSPICERMLCEFRDVEFLTFTDGVDVFGVSTDSAYAHKEFIQSRGLTFPLISDCDGRISDRFGVKYAMWENHTSVSKRALFIVDDSGTVRYRWVTEDAWVRPNLSEVHDSITSIRE